nr:hypothetical protein [Streptomyces sp. AJS327]
MSRSPRANAARRKAFEDLSQIPWKGREPRARRKAMKAAIAEMEPYRRIVGPATRQRVRSTLRAALNAATAEAAARFVPRARATSDNTAPKRSPSPTTRSIRPGVRAG